MTKLKRPITKGVRVFIAITVTTAVYFGAYAPWRIKRAERKIRELCDQVVVGNGAGSIRGKAEELGLRLIGPERGRDWRYAVSGVRSEPVAALSYVAIDGWAFARWCCEVDIDPSVGTIASKKVFPLN